MRQRMLEDLQIRNYAASTIECYIRSVAEFAKHFNKSPEQLGPEEIRIWQLHLLHEKRVKLSTYIQAVCGLRFFYRNTLSRKIDIEHIPLPRYQKKLPVILSKEEVKALLKSSEVKIEIDLKSGDHSATAWGCDLSRKYVDINTEYS